MLKTVGIIVGSLAALIRLAGVVSPEYGRRMLKGMIANPGWLPVFALVVTLLGALFIHGVYLEEQAGRVVWQTWVFLVLGVLMALGGLVFLATSRIPIRLMTRFSEMGTNPLRMLFLLGAVVALFIVWCAVTLP